MIAVSILPLFTLCTWTSNCLLALVHHRQLLHNSLGVAAVLGLPFPGYHPVSAKTDNTPAQSLKFLKEHVNSLCGPVQAKTLEKLLG